MVYVLSKSGKPLMPTKKFGMVRHFLKDGLAKVVNYNPFTIQLTYASAEYRQPVNLGIDEGYETIGFSAVTDKEEVFGGECETLKGQVERNEERAMYRSNRRSCLRYRAPRFDNRKKKSELPPSLKNKLDTCEKIIEVNRKILPITEITIEVAGFDIQAIKNPDIKGKKYQEGEQKGFWNLREYILHRDSHQCQNPVCTTKNSVLQVHHLGFWKNDKTDRPSNLITLCTRCHTPRNHQPDGLLQGWQPKLSSFRAATFMTSIRWRLVNKFGCNHTYGHITKSKRIALGLEKSHHNDAFIIAGGTTQPRIKPTIFIQRRRNNRSLQKFYDTKYIDIRTGKKASGKELFCGRTTRNKEKNGHNLRIYRGEKISKGRVSIRKQRYPYQPGDIVLFEGQKYIVKGAHNKGTRIILVETAKSVKVESVKILRYGKGLKAI